MCCVNASRNNNNTDKTPSSCMIHVRVAKGVWKSARVRNDRVAKLAWFFCSLSLFEHWKCFCEREWCPYKVHLRSSGQWIGLPEIAFYYSRMTNWSRVWLSRGVVGALCDTLIFTVVTLSDKQTSRSKHFMEQIEDMKYWLLSLILSGIGSN